MIYAFDCDGTLEWGVPKGPVTESNIRCLRYLGHVVAIISDSGNCRQAMARLKDLVLYVPTPQPLRWMALIELKRKLKLECVYVSDNPGDDVQSRMAGCSYIHPNNWRPLACR